MGHFFHSAKTFSLVRGGSINYPNVSNYNNIGQELVNCFWLFCRKFNNIIALYHVCLITQPTVRYVLHNSHHWVCHVLERRWSSSALS